jgi:hypothetical protein
VVEEKSSSLLPRYYRRVWAGNVVPEKAIVISQRDFKGARRNGCRLIAIVKTGFKITNKIGGPQ